MTNITKLGHRELNCLSCGTIDKKGTGKLKDGTKCPECNGQGTYYYLPRTSNYDMVPDEEVKENGR